VTSTSASSARGIKSNFIESGIWVRYNGHFSLGGNILQQVCTELKTLYLVSLISVVRSEFNQKLIRYEFYHSFLKYLSGERWKNSPILQVVCPLTDLHS
jgi:hypothetical protein